MAANTQSMIFTIYGDYISHYGSKIWIGSLIRLLKEFGHNEQNVRVAVSRMVKQGWLQSERQGNKSYYYLTEQGELRITEAGNRIFKLKPRKWDGKWRIVSYTIPEEERHIRDELRKELQWSGFGTFSNGSWISPNRMVEEINQLIKRYNIEDYIELFLADNVGPKDDHELVKKSWDLASIEAQYETFIDEYSKQFIVHKSMIERNELSDADCFVERARLVHEYRKFLFVDPGLPNELLPKMWNGNHAAHLFSEYYKLLAGPASDFFERIFERDNDLYKKDKTYDAEEHPYII